MKYIVRFGIAIGVEADTPEEALEQAEEAVKVWEVWDPNTKYLPLQKVSRLGSSYICITTNVGVDPALDVPSSTGKGSFWQLIAQKGDKGEQGPAGPQGLTGAQGIQGPRGLTGERGPQGIQGIQGPQGTQGATGAAGPQGPAGPQGVQGPPGPRGIDGVAVATSGMVAFNVSEEGHLLCSYTGDEPPNYYIGEDGHLYLEV